MLQELLMNGFTEERKFSIPAPQLPNTTPSSSEAPQQKLRCPRCESTNTKFCYYNNYNLTQPRHFCKTCRRYWTKGGALRNVPIGGGCRKTKSSSSSAAHKTRPLMSSSSDMISSTGFDGIIPRHMPLALGPYNSHLMDLLKGSTQMQSHYNHGLISNFSSCRMIKQEMGDGDHNYQQQMRSGLLSDVPTSSGIQELYQRLQRSNNSCGSQTLEMGGNDGGGTSSANYVNYCSSFPLTAGAVSAAADSIMETIPGHNGDAGLWNNTTMAWSDISASKELFP